MAKSVKHSTFAFNEQIRYKNRVFCVFGQEMDTFIFHRISWNVREKQSGGCSGVIFLMAENRLLLLCVNPVSSTKWKAGKRSAEAN